jgi:hypothetical protein
MPAVQEGVVAPPVHIIRLTQEREISLFRGRTLTMMIGGNCVSSRSGGPHLAFI